MFLQPKFVKINNHFISPDSQYFLDHTLLIVNRVISKKFIQDK